MLDQIHGIIIRERNQNTPEISSCNLQEKKLQGPSHMHTYSTSRNNHSSKWQQLFVARQADCHVTVVYPTVHVLLVGIISSKTFGMLPLIPRSMHKLNAALCLSTLQP